MTQTEHALVAALEKLLDLPLAKEQLKNLDRGIGTKTMNSAWIEARDALALAKEGK